MEGSAAVSGVSVRMVPRIAAETTITTRPTGRQVGPTKADEYRDILLHGLTEEHDAAVGGIAPLPLAGDD